MDPTALKNNPPPPYTLQFGLDLEITSNPWSRRATDSQFTIHIYGSPKNVKLEIDWIRNVIKL